MPQPQLQLRLTLGRFRFGPGKAELLGLIQRHGSITAAGRGMKMSYKRAWSLVEEMNAAFTEPLVITERGGAGHGGAQVTAAGLAVLQAYRQLAQITETAGAAEIAAFATRLLPSPGQRANDMSDQT